MMSDDDRVGTVPSSGSYYNLEEIASACTNLAARYPGTAACIGLPYATHESRTCHALRLGNAAAQGSKSVFMMIGGLHGCEWGSCEILLNLAADLLGAYDQQVPLTYGPNGIEFSAAQVSALLDTLDIVVLPMANPDGLKYSHELTAPPKFRKNRNLGTASTPDEKRLAGVDLNRNFEFLFDFQAAFAAGNGISVSDQPLEDLYQGACPFSEPETKNICWLVQQYPTTRCFVDLHTGARDVILPWGDDEVQQIDSSLNFRDSSYDHQRGFAGDGYREYLDFADGLAMRTLARVYADAAQATYGSVYGIKPGFVFAPSCGTSHDWMYSRHLVDAGATKTLAFAIEWYDNDTHITPLPSELPKFVEEVCAGLVALGLAVAASY